jgi:hypothetical protein
MEIEFVTKNGHSFKYDVPSFYINNDSHIYEIRESSKGQIEVAVFCGRQLVVEPHTSSFVIVKSRPL